MFYCFAISISSIILMSPAGIFNPCPLKGEGCCNLPKIFLKQLFVPNLNWAKRFYVIISASFLHLLIYMRWNLGVSFGWGSSKRMVGRVGEIQWFFILHPFLKYLTRRMLQTFCVDENHHFLTHSAKNPAKIPCFYEFFSKKLIFDNSCIHIFKASKFPRARWV